MTDLRALPRWAYPQLSDAEFSDLVTHSGFCPLCCSVSYAVENLACLRCSGPLQPLTENHDPPEPPDSERTLTMSLLTLTTENFTEKVLSHGEPFLACFSAPWCSACRQLYPTLESLSAHIPTGTIDPGSNRPLASKYQIRSIPQLLVFRGDAEPLYRFPPGVHTHEEIARILIGVRNSSPITHSEE